MSELQNLVRDIRTDWENPHFGAVPYLNAMAYLSSVHDNYGADSGDMIVRYFLSNATTWRGETARRVKKRLNEMLKEKR